MTRSNPPPASFAASPGGLNASLLAAGTALHLSSLALLLGLMGGFSISVALADERVDARRNFQQGMALIEGGEYLEGISYLERAYRILPHPSVLFNIGRAYLDAERYADAVDALERYLSTNPEDRDEARRLLTRARQRRAAEEREPGGSVPDVTHAAPSSQPPAPSRSESDTTDDTGLAGVETDLLRALERVRTLRGGSSAGEVGGASVSVGGNPAPGAVSSATEGAGGGPRASDIAGPPAADPYALQVITSSRYSQDPLDAPSTITVLTREDLERSGVHTLPDLLRRVPGLEVMAVSPSDYNIGIRGFNATLSNKVLVLVDGRSVYLDFVGATLWPMLSISLTDVERIEVIRGPGAALYGAGAFSGVVNIITRAPGSGTDAPEVRVQSGVPDYTVASVHLTGQQGATAYRASVGFDGLERWSTELSPDRVDYEQPAAFPDYADRVGRLDLRVDHRFDRTTSISLSGGIAAGQTEFAAIGALREFFVAGNLGYLRGDLVLPGGFSVRTFWNRFDAVAVPWSIAVGGLDLTSHPRTDVLDVEVQRYHEFKTPIVQRLNMGVGYRYKGVDWEWLPRRFDEHHLSAFVQDELRFVSTFSTVLSLRLDRHPLLAALPDGSSLDRVAFSPRGAVLWQVVPGHSVRGALGTAFRTPTFLESYIEQAIPTGSDAFAVLTRGNQGLQPERIFSLEVGYRHHPASHKRELELVAFFNGVNGLLEFGALQPVTDPGGQYDPELGLWIAGTTTQENVDAVHLAQGVEASARFFPLEGLDTYANYAFTHIQRGMATGAPAVESTSRHKLNAGVRYTRASVGLSVDVSVRSAQTWTLRSFDEQGQVVYQDLALPTYSWMTSKLTYRWPGLGLEVGAEANNLLAVLQAEVGEGETTVATPGGTHREYPLGQTLPPSVGLSAAWRFW